MITAIIIPLYIPIDLPLFIFVCAIICAAGIPIACVAIAHEDE